MIVWYMQI